MSSQSTNTPSVSSDSDGQGQGPAAGFGANEWLVDEIYQQYRQASFERWREHDPALRLPRIVAGLEELVRDVKARATVKA